MNQAHRLIERALVSLPGAALPMVEDELRATLVEFFRKSRAWRQKLENVSSVNGSINLANHIKGGRVFGVVAPLRHENGLIWPMTRKPFPTYTVDLPYRYYTPPSSFSTLVLAPTPTEDLTGLEIEAFLGPLSNGAGAVPEDLLLNYEDAIVSGVVGRLMLQPRRPYSDTRTGALRVTAFRQGINEARLSANKGRTEAPPEWYYPSWA